MEIAAPAVPSEDSGSECTVVTDAGGSRVWMAALSLAAMVTIVTVVAGQLLLQVGLRHSRPILEESVRTGAAAVGTAVAGQFARAFELGIPLEKLVGVQSYLERIVESSPGISGLALLDGQGRTVAATREQLTGQRFPAVGGGTEATVVVADSSPLYERAMLRLKMALAGASILAGAVAGVLSAGYLTLHEQNARRRMVRTLEYAASGNFRHAVPRDGRGPFSQVAETFQRLVSQVEAARQRLTAAAATIRAIDFDGTLGRGVDALVEPLDRRYDLPDPDQADAAGQSMRDRSGSLPRVVLLAGLYAAAIPMVANFALDRGSSELAAQWVSVLPLLVELALLLIGAGVGMTAAGGSKPMRAVALLVLGTATAATFWCRDFEQFVVLRGLAGLSAGIALAGVSAGSPQAVRLRTGVLLLAFASLVAAPACAGLLGEAIGRRATFLVLGSLTIVAIPLLFGSNRPRGANAGAAALGPLDPATLLIGVPVAMLLLVHVPTGIGYDNYLVGGLVTTITGLGLMFGLFWPIIAGAAAAMVAAALLLHPIAEQEVQVFLVSAAIGIAFGSALASSEAAAVKLRGLIAGCGCGLLLAGISGASVVAIAGAASVAGVAFALTRGRRLRLAPPANA